MKIYPVPATDVLNVEVANKTLVEILSADGKRLLKAKADGNLKIDIESLPPGIYFVKAGNNMAKFVKL